VNRELTHSKIIISIRYTWRR